MDLGYNREPKLKSVRNDKSAPSIQIEDYCSEEFLNSEDPCCAATIIFSRTQRKSVAKIQITQG